jgi:hypothetical protein
MLLRKTLQHSSNFITSQTCLAAAFNIRLAGLYGPRQSDLCAPLTNHRSTTRVTTWFALVVAKFARIQVGQI